jgi:Tfp pilus assembly protein PilE
LIYRSFLKQENPSLVNIVKAAFASNLVSYLMFALVLLPSYNQNNSYKFNQMSISPMLFTVNKYLKFQEEFYVKNNQFASNWNEINESNEMSKVNYISLQYEIQSNKTSATITATPQTEYTLSARGTIFFIGGKDKFIKNICITEPPSMIPPEMPKRVEGGLQCPSGSTEGIAPTRFFK